MFSPLYSCMAFPCYTWKRSARSCYWLTLGSETRCVSHWPLSATIPLTSPPPERAPCTCILLWTILLWPLSATVRQTWLDWALCSSTAPTQPSVPASLPADLLVHQQDWDTSNLHIIHPHLHPCFYNFTCKCWILIPIYVNKLDDLEALFSCFSFFHVYLSWLHSWRAALGHLLEFTLRIQLLYMDWLYSFIWTFIHELLIINFIIAAVITSRIINPC